MRAIRQLAVVGGWAMLACSVAGMAEAFPNTGSGGEQAAPSTQPAVQLGAYCQFGDGPARSDDGAVAYCVRVKYTDAYVWSFSPNELATDPHTPVSPGDPCLNADDTTVGTEGRTLYCNPTVNGRNAGNLVWQLLP